MRFVPHEYQRKAIGRLLEHDHYGLFLDMGLGKTIITLTAIEQLLYDRLEVRKVLIVAPRTVAESTWQNEAAKWDHLKQLSFSTVLGSAKERARALQAEADCYVINRENVEWLCDYYCYDLPFDMLVVDESSSFKNPQAKRFKALKKIPFQRVVILTGTPAPNTLMDLWAQIYLLDKGRRLGKTITEYRHTWFIPDKFSGHIVYSYKLQKGAERDIYRRVATCCMSLKAADYLKLPERIDNVVKVKLTEEARDSYQTMLKDLTLTVDMERITAVTAAALSNKLLQMANGAVYDDEHGVQVLHDCKLNALKEIIEANAGKPVLVFYAYKHDLAELQRAFKRTRVLSGAEAMDEWNAGRIPLLLAHPASTAYGLNLQAGGNIIVWYGLTWSLELYQQANARLHRQGQDKPVIVHHLVAEDTMDENVMLALRTKCAGQDALLEAVKERLKG